MRKGNLVIYFLITVCMTLSTLNSKPAGLNKWGIYGEYSDTTSVTANTAKGWNILSSYVNQDTPDSVEFELILKQNNSITWASEQLVGTITNPNFLPKKIQKLSYDLYRDNVWNVRITTDGMVYLSQLKGEVLKISTLPGSPFVLPVKVRYKNN